MPRILQTFVVLTLAVARLAAQIPLPDLGEPPAQTLGLHIGYQSDEEFVWTAAPGDALPDLVAFTISAPENAWGTYVVLTARVYSDDPTPEWVNAHPLFAKPTPIASGPGLPNVLVGWNVLAHNVSIALYPQHPDRVRASYLPLLVPQTLAYPALFWTPSAPTCAWEGNYKQGWIDLLAQPDLAIMSDPSITFSLEALQEKFIASQSILDGDLLPQDWFESEDYTEAFEHNLRIVFQAIGVRTTQPEYASNATHWDPVIWGATPIGLPGWGSGYDPGWVISNPITVWIEPRIAKSSFAEWWTLPYSVLPLLAPAQPGRPVHFHALGWVPGATARVRFGNNTTAVVGLRREEPGVLTFTMPPWAPIGSWFCERITNIVGTSTFVPQVWNQGQIVY